MVQKVPCQKCGALILPTTAESTGGLCIPCQQGTRESIEAAKEYYRQFRDYNPQVELWRYLDKLAEKDIPSLSKLTPEQKTYYTVGIFDGEVLNGGFEQFFSNSSGAYYRFVVDGLLELSDFKTLKLLQEAKQLLLGDRTVPTDDEERDQLIDFLPEGSTGQIRMDQIHDAYYEDINRLNTRLLKYAEEKNLLTPFRKPQPDS